MRKFVVFIFSILLSILSLGQVTPKFNYSVPTLTTDFGINFPMGTTILNLSDSSYWFSVAAVDAGDDLTSAAIKFKEIPTISDISMKADTENVLFRTNLGNTITPKNLYKTLSIGLGPDTNDLSFLSVNNKQIFLIRGENYFGSTKLTQNNILIDSIAIDSVQVPNTNRQWASIDVSADGRIQSACATNSYIYTSEDYGKTWTAVTSAGEKNWRCITMSADGRIQAAVVNQDNIYESTNFGKSWTQINWQSGKYWRSVSISSDGKVQIANELMGYSCISYDFGVTWVTMNAPASNWISSAISSDGKIQTMSGSGDKIYTSHDFGVTWTSRTTVLKSFYVNAMSDDGRYQIAAATPNDSVYVSTNFGVTWKTVSSVGVKNWNSAAVSASGRIMIVGAYLNGGVYVSYDYGSNWVETRAGVLDWKSLAMSSDGRVVAGAVQYDNYIYESYAKSLIEDDIILNGKLFVTQKDSIPGTASTVVVMKPTGELAIQAVSSGDSPWTEDLTNGKNWLFPTNYSTDSVGIGTNAPTAKLDIIGKTRMTLLYDTSLVIKNESAAAISCIDVSSGVTTNINGGGQGINIDSPYGDGIYSVGARGIYAQGIGGDGIYATGTANGISATGADYGVYGEGLIGGYFGTLDPSGYSLVASNSHGSDPLCGLGWECGLAADVQGKLKVGLYQRQYPPTWIFCDSLGIVTYYPVAGLMSNYLTWTNNGNGKQTSTIDTVETTYLRMPSINNAQIIFDSAMIYNDADGLFIKTTIDDSGRYRGLILNNKSIGYGAMILSAGILSQGYLWADTNTARMYADSKTVELTNSGLKIDTLTKLTTEGGYAVKFKAGEALNKGEVVSIGTADETVIKAADSTVCPIGVVYADASSGADVWVVTSGRAYVLAKSDFQAARGDVVNVGTTAGKIDSHVTIDDYLVTSVLDKYICWIIGTVTKSASGAGVATYIIVNPQAVDVKRYESAP